MVGNAFCSSLLIKLLLNQRWALRIQITDRALQAAASNICFAVELMELLLDRCDPDVHISEAVLKAANRNVELRNLLFNRRGISLKPSEPIPYETDDDDDDFQAYIVVWGVQHSSDNT